MKSGESGDTRFVTRGFQKLAHHPEVSNLKGMFRFSRPQLFIFFVLGMALIAQGSEKAKRLTSAVQLLEQWQSDQHLYLVGDLNLSENDLNELEKWLDQNGPNWAVLLTQSSTEERYQGAFGDRLSGVDAVETALTGGLPSKTGFGDLRDQKTQLRNGALFVIYLTERKLTYFGSEYYSRNGAAPSRFRNGLDSEARKAMKDGGRIIDAVQGTITSIDAKAKGSITQREQNRVASAENAKKELVALRDQFNEVAEKNATIKSEGNPGPFPDEKLRTQLNALESQPGIYDSRSIRKELEQWDRFLDNYRKDRDEFKTLEERLGTLTPASEKGKSNLKDAQAHLAVARESYQVGNPSYQKQLADAKNSVAMIDFEDQAARRAAARRKDTLKVGGITSAAGLCVIGVIGNRRRRRIKAEAEALLAARKLEMKATEERLFELMDRSAVIVGPFNKLESRGYQGETLALSQQALKHIDEAFVLSSNVQRIIEEGEDLIAPGNPFSRSRNIVSGGRYERAVDLLDAELNLGLQNVPNLKERTRPGEEVDETFSVPIDEWGSRTKAALDTASTCLDRIEDAWSTIIARRESLHQNIDTLASRQNEIQVDEWLRCERLFEEWIPAMSDLEIRAAKTGESDPVRALDGDMSEGDRMAHEAKTQLDLLSRFRSDHWEELEQGEAVLDSRRRATIWVDQHLADLSKVADDIATKSPAGAVSAAIQDLNSSLQALAQRVQHAASLIVRADEQALPKIESTTQLVKTARREIAASLTLDSEEILREIDHDPSYFLNKARQQHEASLAALDLGEASGAEGFLNETDALVSHASELVERTRHILSDYHKTSEALWQRRGLLKERGKQLEGEVSQMRHRYAPRALFLDPHSPELGTFADSPTQLASHLRVITTRLDGAKTRFQAGGLLESWDLILNGQKLAEEGETLCQDVTTRFKKLAEMEQQNTDRHHNQTRASADFDEPVRDRRVTLETIIIHETISTKLSETVWEMEVGDGLRDPFQVEMMLDDLSERLPILRKAIAEDLEQNQRALQLLDTVKRNQQEAGLLWKTAETDQIPNSQKTNESMNAIEENHGRLQDAQRELEVDHADWRKIQNSLRAIHLALSEAVSDLKQELKLARETVRALEGATREVQNAARWSGSYGIRITGNYGGRSLASANDAMQHGHYQEALQMAGQARARARSAIAQAEAREAAKRRAAAAARRRQRQSASRSSFGSSGISSSTRNNFGSSSSFSSSRSRGASSGRSSFSSGSGAGRSGW